MLIIFDLDDTLIDTSDFVTPRKMKDALRKMVKAGCPIADFENALEYLLFLNKTAKSSKEALKEFIEKRGFSHEFLTIGLREVYESSLENLTIPPVEGVIETLSFLKKESLLAVVTMGKLDRQMEKLKKAGIDSSFFYKIVCLEEGSKKNAYASLLEELSMQASEVIVCGDRLEVDLFPAKEIGCTTVHIKRGRGAYAENSAGSFLADFTITRPSEVVDIFFELKRVNKED